MCMKFILKKRKSILHSEKKEEYPSLIIAEIFASKWDVYLSL